MTKRKNSLTDAINISHNVRVAEWHYGKMFRINNLIGLRLFRGKKSKRNKNEITSAAVSFVIILLSLFGLFPFTLFLQKELIVFVFKLRFLFSVVRGSQGLCGALRGFTGFVSPTRFNGQLGVALAKRNMMRSKVYVSFELKSDIFTFHSCNCGK